MYVLCALFVAFTAVCEQILIPIQPVPIVLGTIPIFMAGVVLGPKYGTISMLVYILLGAVGVPVFAMARGGLAILAGPTGGFILAWPFTAACIGGLTRHFGYSTKAIILSMLSGNILCYIFGVVWFLFLTQTHVWTALTACVFPFLLGDALKIIAATFLSKRCRRLLQ
jgi:biotin transport system substrate-specific component